MWAQILRAGPSLMFMVDMRCSSFSSSSACPSISCDRNWEASSSQPARKRRGRNENMCNSDICFQWDSQCQCVAVQTVPPCSEEINWDTSSTLHWAGMAGRQLGAEPSVGRGGAGWWQEAEDAGERDMGSSSSSSTLDSSSEWLDSERHCGEETGRRPVSEATERPHLVINRLHLFDKDETKPPNDVGVLCLFKLHWSCAATRGQRWLKAAYRSTNCISTYYK